MSVKMLLLICYGCVIDKVECILGMIMILCREEKKKLKERKKEEKNKEKMCRKKKGKKRRRKKCKDIIYDFFLLNKERNKEGRNDEYLIIG